MLSFCICSKVSADKYASARGPKPFIIINKNVLKLDCWYTETDRWWNIPAWSGPVTMFQRRAVPSLVSFGSMVKCVTVAFLFSFYFREYQATFYYLKSTRIPSLNLVSSGSVVVGRTTEPKHFE
jgi:hypothetical protein